VREKEVYEAVRKGSARSGSLPTKKVSEHDSSTYIKNATLVDMSQKEKEV